MKRRDISQNSSDNKWAVKLCKVLRIDLLLKPVVRSVVMC